MKEKSTFNNEDLVFLIRSAMKISSSFLELDTIVDLKKYHKNNFKKESNFWVNMMEIHIEPIMNEIAKENPDFVNNIFNIVSDCFNKVQLDKPEQTSLLCFYVYLRSAVNDINKLQGSSKSWYPIVIKVSTEKLIKTIENQYRFIADMKDSDGNGVDYLIDYLDDLGEKTIFFSEKK